MIPLLCQHHDYLIRLVFGGLAAALPASRLPAGLAPPRRLERDWSRGTARPAGGRELV